MLDVKIGIFIFCCFVVHPSLKLIIVVCRLSVFVGLLFFFFYFHTPHDDDNMIDNITLMCNERM